MTAVPFDTHAFVKRLTTAGMPESQAEAVTTLVKEAQAGIPDGMATKADITEVRRDLAETKVDILKWVLGAMAFQTAILSAIKFFGH